MCRGFLIDGDRAVEWRKIPDLPIEERSVSPRKLIAFHTACNL
jgi:hypothetical protein